MASVRFNLKRPNAKTSAIECVLSDGRKYRLRLATGISVNPKHWSRRNNNVLSADRDSTTKNTFLYGNGKERVGFGSKVLNIYLEAKEKGLLPDRQYFFEVMNPKPKESTNFWELWTQFIESKQGIFKKHSFIKFHSLKGHLVAFEYSEKRPLILDHLSSEQMEDFQNFLYYKRDLNTQSTEKYLGIFKIFLNWCVKRRLTTNIDFRNFRAIRQPEGLKVVMSEKDIDKIKAVALGDKNYLVNVRSLFILACNTGLRYSDFSRISKEHLKQDKDGPFLQIRQQKTDDFVSIPLTKESFSTVQDLINGVVRPISNQKMNKYVKELCMLAGINESFEVHQYKGREKTTIAVPKYELVSTHTGRRTFATNLLERGVPAQVVMSFTGHRDYKSFAKYVNIPKRTEMHIVRSALERNMKVA